MVELQIGKPGIRAAAKESARFSLYLVVAVDIADYLLTLGRAYDSGLHKLAEAWTALGQKAEMRFRQLASSHMVHDLRQDASVLASKLGREADLVRGELAHLW